MYSLYGSPNTAMVSPAENRNNLIIRNRKFEYNRQIDQLIYNQEELETASMSGDVRYATDRVGSKRKSISQQMRNRRDFNTIG